MPKDNNNKKEGNQTAANKSGKKKLRKKRLLRVLLVLVALFILGTSIAGFATYRVVSAYMADVPDWDPERLIPSQTSFMYDKDGEQLTRLLGEQNRIPVDLDQMSEDLINAFIAIEDDRFYEHPGFDVRGIMRAAYSNYFRRTGSMQGGSTITQQLIKNAYFDPRDRTMKRKVQELYLAYQMERMFSKEEILSMYLNYIFFDFNAYGVEAAAQTYFGKSAAEVTLAEAAILAGIPNLPGKYSPFRNMDEAKNRQALVLSRMVELEMITAEEAREARAEEIVLAERTRQSMPYPWFTNHVLMEARNTLSEMPEYSQLDGRELWDVLYGGGLHIYTTLDQEKQTFIEKTIDDDSLYPNIRNTDHLDPLQAAVIVADPSTGYVVAMSGGRDYDPETNGMNRAYEGRRPAGSTLKPILAYAPAFNEGIAGPGSILDDAPVVYGGSYRPHNYTRTEFNGLVTARYALLRSLNIPAVELFQKVGTAKGKEYAERMGITSFGDLQELGMVLGGGGVGYSVYDVAQAFSVLANEGVRSDLTTITKITDNDGRVLYEHKVNGEEILSREAAWLTTDALKDAVARGTAAGVRIGRPLAAKTGTSDYDRDVWLAAYTPDYVTVFWLGRDKWPDKDKTIGHLRSGGHTNPFMNPILRFIHEGLPSRDFTRPSGLRQASICTKSGKRPGENCPSDHIASDWFLSGKVPSETCDMHVQLEVCTVSGNLATEFCPEELREVRAFLNRPEYITTTSAWRAGAGRVPADAALMPPSESCTMHTFRPGDPQELRASSDTEGNVTLNWRAGSNASGYFIFRKAPGEDAFKQMNKNATDQLSYTDSKLAPGSYTYQVISISSEGVKSAAVSVTVRVDEPPPPPPPPPGNGNGNGGNGDDDDNNDNGDNNATDSGNRGRGNN